MPRLDTPEQQAKLLDMLFADAEREIEGFDSGIPVAAPEVFERFKAKLADLGLRLSLDDVEPTPLRREASQH